MKSERVALLTTAVVVVLVVNMTFVGAAFAADTFYTDETAIGLITGGPSATNWYFYSASGQVAYCLDTGDAPPVGTYYSSPLTPSNPLKWILYYGYPNHTTIGGVALTDDEARQATQAAVWALQTGSGIGAWHANNSHQPDSGLAYDAAVYLYNNCNGALPSGGVTLTNPANADVQPYNSTYVRVGPYRATANYQMSSIAISVTGISGYVIGNASGVAITPTNGADFYVYLPVADMTSVTSANLRVTANYRNPVWYCYSAFVDIKAWA